MTTTNKDFRVKNGLIVEGNSATVNGNQVITTASSLDSLSDVVIITPVTSQVLSYNGTNWVNSSSGGGGGGTTTNALTIGTGLSGTSFNGSTAVTIAIDSTVVTDSGTQTITNKTLTTPKINENVNLTATATELNILDGATLSTTELNYVDGVTSAIQTQIDTKAPIASPTFTGTVTIPAGSAIDGVPYLATANTFTGGVQQITTASAATKGLIIKGAASQTANLMEFQNSSGTALTYFNSSGGLTATEGVISTLYSGGKMTTGTLGYFNATTFSAAVSPIVVRGAASQTGNLQEWQNSAGTILTRVSSGGAVVTSGVGVFGSQSNAPNAQLFVLANSLVYPTFVAKAIASQTANLTEWQNSAGTVLSAIDTAGNFTKGDGAQLVLAGQIFG